MMMNNAENMEIIDISIISKEFKFGKSRVIRSSCVTIQSTMLILRRFTIR